MVAWQKLSCCVMPMSPFFGQLKLEGRWQGAAFTSIPDSLPSRGSTPRGGQSLKIRAENWLKVRRHDGAQSSCMTRVSRPSDARRKQSKQNRVCRGSKKSRTVATMPPASLLWLARGRTSWGELRACERRRTLATPCSGDTTQASVWREDVVADAKIVTHDATASGFGQ